MSVPVVQNAKVWLGQYNISGDLNAVAMNDGVETLDDTTIGDTTKSSKAGLRVGDAQVEGFWQGGADNIDDALFSQIDVAEAPFTVAPENAGVEGETAKFYLCRVASYQPGGSVGELLKFSANAESRGQRVVHGSILINATKTATGTGTAFNLGAASASHKIYAALHVISSSGTSPTLDVTVESDSAEAFTSPITQITFTQATEETSEWATPVNGAVADTWWRVNFTIAGTSPSFEFVVALGIQ